MNHIPINKSNSFTIYNVGLINQAPTNNSNPFNNYKCGFDKSSPYMRMLEFFELFD